MAALPWFLAAILLSACSFFARPPQASPVIPVGEPEIVDVGPSTEVINNCGAGGGTVIKHPSRTMISSHAVEWQVAGQAGIGTYIGDGVIPGGVNLRAGLEGRYVSAITEGVQKGIDWELPAEPNTVVEYTLMWREVWQPGYIDIRAGGQSFQVNVRYRTDIRSDIMGKRLQECGEEQAVVPTQNPVVNQLPPTAVPNTDHRTFAQSQDIARWEWTGSGVSGPSAPQAPSDGELILFHGDLQGVSGPQGFRWHIFRSGQQTCIPSGTAVAVKISGGTPEDRQKEAERIISQVKPSGIGHWSNYQVTDWCQPGQSSSPPSETSSQSSQAKYPCPVLVSQSEVDSWKLGQTDVPTVQDYINRFDAKRPNDAGVFVAGIQVPSGVLVATNYDETDASRWTQYDVIPIVHSGSWGLFQTTREYTAPRPGACMTIVP